MFVFSLSAAFDGGLTSPERASALLNSFPLAPPDGVRTAESPRASAALGRWVVVRRDESAAPTWDPLARILFTGDVRLYNRPELLAELELAPSQQGCSDLELARSAFLKWRHDAPRHLVGDFAFAAWDEAAGTVFAARDHLGMRPLYFQAWRGGIGLASDVRQFLPLVDRSLGAVDDQKILDWCLGRVGDLRRTFWRGITRVRPGHYLIADVNGVTEKRYWFPPPPPRAPANYQANCARLVEVYRRSVRDRLESDTPIVAHSSGGFDSSSILALADQIYRQEPRRPPLLMVSGVVPGFPSDESIYMDALAAQVSFEGVRWNIVDDTPDTYPGVSSAAPVLRRGLAGGSRRDLMIARERGARVLLTGLGGDDVWYATGVLRDFVRHGLWPRALSSAIRGTTGLAGPRRILDAALGVLPPATAVRVAHRLWAPSVTPPEWLGPALREIYRVPAPEIAPLDLDWPSHLVCGIWTQLTLPHTSAVIEATVEHGLDDGVEVRAPCLDVRVIEHMLAIPWQQREPRGHFRRTARDALGALLPSAFRERVGQRSWTPVWEATARRVIPALAPLIDGDSWLSEPFIDRGIARAMLWDVMERGDRAAPGSCLLIPEFAALEAWLRGFLL